jgi:hypothetical protein
MERAWEHIEHLKAEIAAFKERQPYRVRQEKESGLGNHVCYFELLEPIPRPIGLIAGECTHQMRATLDNLAWQLGFEHLGMEPHTRTSFPVFIREEGFESHGKGFIADLPNAARQIIVRVQPYHRPERGNHPLWVLHRLWNVDKHRSIHRAFWSLQHFILQTLPVNVANATIGSLHDGQGNCACVPPPGRAGVQIAPRFQIEGAFDEAGPAFERPVIPAALPYTQYVADALLPEFEPFFP